MAQSKITAWPAYTNNSWFLVKAGKKTLIMGGIACTLIVHMVNSQQSHVILTSLLFSVSHFNFSSGFHPLITFNNFYFANFSAIVYH